MLQHFYVSMSVDSNISDFLQIRFTKKDKKPI